MNLAIILGRLASDPELKHSAKGTAFCNFRVATDESYKDQEGKVIKATEWHNIVTMGRVAETCSQYLKKGSQTLVEGKIQTRSWDKDGTKHYMTEIKAHRVKFLGAKNGSEKIDNIDVESGDVPF